MCMAAGALHTFVATTSFTLAWTHSIEKIRREEDYRIVGDRLELVEARIRGSGAGMEMADDARLRDGIWHYRPALAPLPALRLARSTYTSDYELCAAACRPLSDWIPIAAGTTELTACTAPSAGH